MYSQTATQNLGPRLPMMKMFKVPSLTMTFSQRSSLPRKVVSLINCLILCNYPLFSGLKWNLATASLKMEVAEFPELLHCFLYDQQHPNARILSAHVSIDACPKFHGKISVFHSAAVTFRAPSDPSGPRSMRREYIHATPSWRGGHSRYDCVFVNSHPELTGMRGLTVACVFLFFSFLHEGARFTSALVQWFSIVGTIPDDETGLWMVQPDFHDDERPYLGIIPLESIFRAAHLIPVYRTSEFVSRSLTMHDTLDEFKLFYVNKFVDHHAFEIIY